MDPNVSVAFDDLARRRPDCAWRARQLALRDQRFRAICEDYAEALRAMELWSRKGAAGKDRFEEFRRIAVELQEELLEYLKSSNYESR